ncbi:MAG: hypothetical protein V3U60_11305 [Gammaproteobacteria bacterium]
MNVTSKTNTSKNAIQWFPIVIAVLASGVGAGGGLYIGSTMTPAQLQEIARPDPFTGADGAALEKRISDLERRITLIEDRVRDDYLEELENRLERLESR